MTRKKKILTIAGGLILIAVIGTGVYFGTRKTETNSTELAYVYRVSLMNPASQVQRMAGMVEPQETWEVQKSSDREVEQILVKAGDEVRAKTKERKDYLLRIGAVIEKDEPKASTSK